MTPSRWSAREVAGDTPAGLEGAKMLMLVNRETGKGLGVTLFESEEAMRRGDEALNAMSPGCQRAPHIGRVLRGARETVTQRD